MKFLPLTSDLLSRTRVAPCHICGWSTVVRPTWRHGWLCASCLDDLKAAK